MHPEYIKAELRKNSKTQRSIAADLGISSMAVSHVIEGRQKSARVASAIAKAIKSPVNQIWPGKYPQLVLLEKAPQRNTAQLKAELQQLNPRRTSGRKAMAV